MQTLYLRKGKRWVTVTCNWLTAKEAAVRAKVTTHSIWRWIREDRLKYYKTPGGAIRICEKDLMYSGSSDLPMVVDDELPSFLRRRVYDSKD